MLENNMIHIDQQEISKIMDRYKYSEAVREIIKKEKLLPAGLLKRLHSNYPRHSGIFDTAKFLFSGKEHYSGLKGYREIIETLEEHGIDIGYQDEREMFIKVYRFLATKHVLNTIDWSNFEKDGVFQLVFPQPGMIKQEAVEKYKKATAEEEKQAIVNAYMKETNPHDGKQKLNKPWFENDKGEIEFLEGVQHKYPQCQLVFDMSTQSCFAFCTYCFRHAQVRGDEDMFIQYDVKPVIEYWKRHKEITDALFTGGDAGYLSQKRLEEYLLPIIDDPELGHIRTVRIGSRMLTFHPEMILQPKYEKTLALFRKLVDNGIQVAWMSHTSTPREIMNPSSIAAIRRLKASGVTVKSQSPIMNHISLYTKEDGSVDIDRSAQNWIDLGNIFAMMGMSFHSIYCARPTGEHHYFTAPLADINKIFSKIYRTLPSISRPSRYITMTSSAGKISIIGTTEIKGEKVFVLKFNEGRNMEWLDRVYLAKYDEKENTIARLIPYEGDKHFYEDELKQIELDLEKSLADKLKKQ